MPSGVECGLPTGSGTASDTHYSRRHREEPSQWGTPLPELLYFQLLERTGIHTLEILASCSGLLRRRWSNDQELLHEQEKVTGCEDPLQVVGLKLLQHLECEDSLVSEAPVIATSAALDGSAFKCFSTSFDSLSRGTCGLVKTAVGRTVSLNRKMFSRSKKDNAAFSSASEKPSESETWRHSFLLRTSLSSL